ncbi:MAG: AP protein [Gemmatimonadetes bacterium]|nr:AP protein [Gemmatimonadota bacterium]
MKRACAVLTLALTAWPVHSSLAIAQAPLRTRNVVLIVTDGLRWQEVFSGPDQALFNERDGGVEDTLRLRADFWTGAPAEGRERLLPFFWSVIAREGQLFGNQALGSVARVTNGLKFSYPGYNEMLTGRADPRIDRNDYGPNPNVTVFEWLNRQPEFRGRVAAFGTWGAFGSIFNRERSGLFVQAGWQPPSADWDHLAPRQQLLEALFQTTTRLWDDNVYDALMQQAVLDYVRVSRPHVLFVGYGETDEWAHSRRYDLHLRSAHTVNRFVAELWDTMQAMQEYRGVTTFLITTDHGRGSGPADWTDHGRRVDGAENIWIAVLGPDTAPLGERRNVAPVTQSQIAATVAALLGKDFRQAVPGSAPPIADVIRRR